MTVRNYIELGVLVGSTVLSIFAFLESYASRYYRHKHALERVHSRLDDIYERIDEIKRILDKQ